MNPANNADRPMHERSMTTDTPTVTPAKATKQTEVLKISTKELNKALDGQDSYKDLLQNFVKGT